MLPESKVVLQSTQNPQPVTDNVIEVQVVAIPTNISSDFDDLYNYLYPTPKFPF